MRKDSFFVSMVTAIVASYILTFIVHGYAHNAIAWWYGLNNHPLRLNFASLWLENVSENLEFAQSNQQGEYYMVGIIGFVSYAANWVLLGFSLVSFNSLPKHAKGINFLYWLFVWNLCLVFNYIPHYLFSAANIGVTFDDMGVSSVWLAYVIGGAGALAMVCVLYFYLLQQVFIKLSIHGLVERRIYFILSLIITMFYNGIRYGGSHAGILFTSAGIFIWIKLFVLFLLCRSINLHKQS